MRTTAILAAAILAVASTSVWAQRNQTIETPEGRITLTHDKCSSGPGKDAIMVLNRPGGGFGCWTTSSDTVVIKWHTLMGANGNPLPSNFTTTHPTP